MPMIPQQFILRLLFIGFGMTALASCGDSSVDPRSRIYESLRFDHYAVNLVPSDTFRVSAKPYAANGGVIRTGASIVFRSTDTNIVRIASDGHVGAMRPGTVLLLAELTIDTVMHRDTLRIRVLNAVEPPRITSFSLQMPANDSAVVLQGGVRQIPTTIMNGSAPADPVLVDYWVSDTSIARVIPDRFLYGARAGQTMVYASTTVAGTKWIDSVRYTVRARP